MKKDTSSSSTCGKLPETARESTTHGLIPCEKVVERVVENLLKRELREKLLKFPEKALDR